MIVHPEKIEKIS